MSSLIATGVAIFWVLLSSFCYGYHISVSSGAQYDSRNRFDLTKTILPTFQALNAPQKAISCSPPPPPPRGNPPPFPPCIPLTLSQYGFVTSAFVLGGLLSCISTSTKWTYLRPTTTLRKRFALCAAVALVGELIQAYSVSFKSLTLGRLVTGFGAAGGMGLVPPTLAELAPASLKGSVGVLHQLAIVVGILAAQAVGLVLSQPTLWRVIPMISALASFIQIVAAPCISIPPVTNVNASAAISARENAVHEEESLLPDIASVATSTDTPASIFAPEAQKGTLISLAAMLLQQFSGINAVLFYSTTLLSPLFPSQAAYLAFYLTAFNALMTFPPIFLVHSLGPRRLLLLSVATMFVSCVELGWAINTQQSHLAAAGVFLMVGSFAVGLGPIPFLLPPLLSPASLIPQISSVSLLLNFVSNLVVGALFLPVRDALSRPGHKFSRRVGEGNVFFVFALALAVGGIGLARWWR